MFLLKKIDFRTAGNFIDKNHKHHKKPQGHKFSFGVFLDQELIAVFIFGRPISRILDDKKTLEITRICTLGNYKNLISWSLAKIIKFIKIYYKEISRIITYILEQETGASLKASNFTFSGFTKGRKTSKNSWGNRENRQFSEISKLNKKRFEFLIN